MMYDREKSDLAVVASAMWSSIDWRIWSFRRTSYVMSTTPRVDGSGVGS
jgi:hypothetical protein